ncbi:MAG: hypothetical protein HY053_04090 [Proteobacteria bacterium]|nr:hypothetical protein [Pseudomonadota bacterium]
MTPQILVSIDQKGILDGSAATSILQEYRDAMGDLTAKIELRIGPAVQATTPEFWATLVSPAVDKAVAEIESFNDRKSVDATACRLSEHLDLGFAPEVTNRSHFQHRFGRIFHACTRQMSFFGELLETRDGDIAKHRRQMKSRIGFYLGRA